MAHGIYVHSACTPGANQVEYIMRVQSSTATARWLTRPSHAASHSGGDPQPITNIKSPLLYQTENFRGISALLVFSLGLLAWILSRDPFFPNHSSPTNLPPPTQWSLRPTTRLADVMRASHCPSLLPVASLEPNSAL